MNQIPSFIWLYFKVPYSPLFIHPHQFQVHSLLQLYEECGPSEDCIHDTSGVQFFLGDMYFKNSSIVPTVS